MDTIRSIQRTLNRLLPFASPNTPLYQDIIHALVLCAALYYAPRFFEARTQQQLAEPEAPEDNHDLVNGTDSAPRFQNNEAEQPADNPQEAIPIPEEFPANHHGLPQPNGNNQVFIPPEPEAGPANQDAPVRPRQTAASRTNVGKKKAASIARRDQMRAYNEFQRVQGDEQRARAAAEAEERAEELEAERRRRDVVEQAARKREEKERAERKARMERERELEYAMARDALKAVREALRERGMADLEAIARAVKREFEGREWLARLVRAEGMLGLYEGVLTMCTAGGWVVRLDRKRMDEVYQRAADWGGGSETKIEYEDLGVILGDVLSSHAKA
ncbi:hypothetical protein K402DRAFT_394867 [Aulographum hederae CBS 113979]|uniref:Uncharacterized protein n=1 Tax=Aulographum hederae CBS 113979 TaxID=1176131 RepID=A0A6G1GWI0_9PEZI|nr:hypothetical protein K402DRAFT_394867 [Aulographum hederae CBS 113979]